MQLRTLVPSLALTSVAALGAQAKAAELGAGISIGGFVDAILTIQDDDIADDTSIDFTGDAVLQFSSAIGDAVSLNVDLQISGDADQEDDPEAVVVRQAYSTWDVNEDFSLQFGRSISWIGYQAAYAPGLWRVGVTPYAGDYYGNDTVGVWGTFNPSDNVSVTLAVVDDIIGFKTEMDSFAIGGQAVIGIESYGSVEVEFQFDPSGADYFDDGRLGAEVPEADDGAMTLLVHTTADKLVEGATFGAEVAYADYDVASSLAFMAMANYGFTDKASGTLMVSYWEPNDDADDDEAFEFAAAILTNPTGDSNFAVNFEVGMVSTDADDTLTIMFEALAVIP